MKIPFVTFLPMEKELKDEMKGAFDRVLARSWYIGGIEDEEFETLNGFLISRLDKIPEPDEQFDVDYGGYNFKIISVESKMIQSVLVTKLPEEPPEDVDIEEEK